MMFAVRMALGLLAFSAACGDVSAAVLPAPKVPLDYKAYDGWNSIVGTVVSDDGRYVAYALVPEDGDPVLVVHDFTTGRDLREARGDMPAFTADGRFVVYVVRAPNADIHRAKREHKKPDDQPKNGLGILDLTTGTATTVDRVKDFKLAKDTGHDTLAYALESPAPATATSAAPAPAASVLPSLAPSPSPTPAPMPTPSMAPSPGASASPPDDLHKKDTGTTLVVRDLAAGRETRVSAVTAYALAHDGAFVAYAIESKDGSGDEVRAFGVNGAATFDVMRAPGHYKNLTFAPKHELLAFVSDAATFSNPAPTYALYQSDLSRGAGSAVARVLVDAKTPTFSDAPPSENGALSYSKDGARLFFGVAPAPTPVPSGTPEPMKVDIWNWHDLDLQSTQRKNADMERRRTYAAVVSSAGAAAGATRLATATVRDIVSNENPTIALGLDDVRYRKERSWDTEYADIYAVSLADGSRRLLISKLRDDPSLSPNGGYVVAYDTHARSWYSVDTHDGTRRDLTRRLAPAFYDELDDHPAPPPPYGLAGWLDGDRYVLLRDRYDVWAIDPRTGASRDLTGGVGRKRHIVFVPQQLDPDAESFDSAKPIVLGATNDDTKDQGIWRVAASGATAFVPQRITMLPKAVTIVARARSAGRVVVAERTFSEMGNLWATPDLGTALTRVSDANPQRANYLWGDEHLVSFHSTWGVPLKGVLYTPDNFDPHKKYPMLVYFYERFSNYYHEMPFTVPAPNTSPTLVRYVSNGYVVFVPDVAYRIGHPGESALDCIVPAVDSIVRRGFVDPARIGIAGHSWAAYQIAYIITRTNRFRAAEAGAAVANMTSAYGGIRLESGNVRESQYERGQSRIGATPWDRTDLYIENSALFHIRNVNTPYLTIANELDGAVPQSQGIEFFTALRRLGKEAYLFSFDGEDHNLVGREQKKYWTVHLDEFFDHFLRGKPAPDWMTEGVDFLHRGQRDVDTTLYGEKW
jgi:dipeptidyl aminopeptidase/acylaminoacyl peptidase